MCVAFAYVLRSEITLYDFKIKPVDTLQIIMWIVHEIRTEGKYKMRRDQNRWHPPLQPKPLARFGHVRYCFEIMLI